MADAKHPDRAQISTDLPRLAVICDFVEENWLSMDLVAEMLLKNLHTNYASVIDATRVCPRMVPRFARLSRFGEKRAARNADRLLNRFLDYPRFVRKRKTEFDLFHVVDHSYGQLVHQLPPHRTIVTCHDLDTFRCLLEPALDRRSKLFKAMAKRILRGFCKASLVTCDSVATRDELFVHELLPPERVVVVPNGVHPTCSPEPDPLTDVEAARLLGPACANAIDILHVGSTIPRKRIDLLLQIFATLRKEFPQARLVRVGGPFTAAQTEMVKQHRLCESLVVLPFLDRAVLAAVYRRAALVLQPSDSEGFGLPVIEAMACGAPVVASDLPVLREVGGKAAAYCPVNDVPAWSESIIKLLHERHEQPAHWSARRAAGIAQSTKFSWAEYTRKMVALYQSVLSS